MKTPLRACLDYTHASCEGGRIVLAHEWLQGQPLPAQVVSEAMIALAGGRVYAALGWSLTPLEG